MTNALRVNGAKLAVAALMAATSLACGGRPGPAGATRLQAGQQTGVTGQTEVEVVKPIEVTLAQVGLDPTALDRSADPCQDFYQFACGGWLAATEIPADESRWYRSFSEIRQRNQAELRRILEDAARAPGSDSPLAKLGDFYASCMDEAAVEKAGLKPVRSLLSRSARVWDIKNLARAISELHRSGVFVLFAVGAIQDPADPTRVMAVLDESGLGLPARDYYLADDPSARTLRTAYQTHVERVFVLTGMAKRAARRAARDVMTVETRLAALAKTSSERRDPRSMLNRLGRADLARVAGNFPWDAYLAEIGAPPFQELMVTSVPYLEGLNQLLVTIKLEIWQNYLTWHVLHATAPTLAKAFVDEDFALEQALSGQAKPKERWRHCLDATDRSLGQLLAQPFVASRFRPEARSAAEQAVTELRRTFSEEIEGLTWMSGRTRTRALEKLAAVAFKIGHPTRWQSYDFAIDRKGYAANVLAASAFELRRQLARIDRPADRDEWPVTPARTDAFYNWMNNEVVVPAGVLQPPLFDDKASPIVDLAAIGMLLGHELTHGFDDEGSQYSATGTLDNWWAPEVAAEFKRRAACLASQYAGYEALPGVRLDGTLTLGENISDLGGLKLAFRAYRTLREEATEPTIAEGFTEDQQFFLAFGQAWCAKIRDETAAVQAKNDPHAPPRFRVDGSLANLPEFGAAFECKPGTPMRPATTCEVW